jgi:hypothetical protein
MARLTQQRAGLLAGALAFAAISGAYPAYPQTLKCNVAFEDESSLKGAWLITSSQPLVAECWDCGAELVVVAKASPEKGGPRATKPAGVESKEVVDELIASPASREKAINSLRAGLQREKPQCSFRFEEDGRKIVNDVHFFAAKYFRECPAAAPEHAMASEWLGFDRGCIFKITIAARYSGPLSA